MTMITIKNMVTLCKIFCSDLNFIMRGVTFCYIDTITHTPPAFTSFNSKSASLLVYYFLRYRKIALAENGLLWILNKCCFYGKTVLKI